MGLHELQQYVCGDVHWSWRGSVRWGMLQLRAPWHRWSHGRMREHVSDTHYCYRLAFWSKNCPYFFFLVISETEEVVSR